MKHEIIEYKPLTEAISYSGEKYYKTCTPAEFTKLRAENESLYFDISKRFVASAHIKDWWEADPQDTIFEYETMQLTKWQRESLKFALEKYKEVNPYKVLTKSIMLTMIDRIKDWKQPYQWPSN